MQYCVGVPFVMLKTSAQPECSSTPYDCITNTAAAYHTIPTFGMTEHSAAAHHRSSMAGDITAHYRIAQQNV
eukprot:798116-Pyramimonas_sp.AAC.1